MTDLVIKIDDGLEAVVTPEALRETLAKLFSHGDPLFQEMTWEEQDLYNRKNYDYAAGGDDPNGNFARIGAIMALYPGIDPSDPRVVALMGALKQLDQVMWSFSRGFAGEVEGLEPRLQDISVYMKIIRMLNRHMEEKKGGMASGT